MSDAVEVFDVLIVGGGLVGSSLACALDRSPLRVALVEATAPIEAPPSFDERNLALNRLSLDALAVLGVLDQLQSAPVPIRSVHVSSAGDFGRVRLRAEDHGVEALGGVVIARELGQALHARLQACGNLARYAPAVVASANPDEGHVEVRLADGRNLRCRLLVIAEGTESALRGALGLGEARKEYAQTLFVSVVEADRPHQHTAFERFTAEGPVAMLPMAGPRLGSVLTVSAEQAEAVAALSDAGYLELLQQRFGWRLGRLRKVGRRSAYPMRLVTAQRLIGPRCVVIGNAAQTLHPIGAQGFNLGLRDALTLAGLLLDDVACDAGASARLQAFVTQRQQDRARTIDFSDGLSGVFAHRAMPVRLLRGLGMAAFDHFQGLASPMVRAAMGMDPNARRVLAQLRRPA